MVFGAIAKGSELPVAVFTGPTKGRGACHPVPFLFMNRHPIHPQLLRDDPMTQPQLRKARSNIPSVSQKLYLSPSQHKRLCALQSSYSELMGRNVSLSVLYARALDLLAGHVQAQLDAKPVEEVREDEKAAVLSCLW